MKDVNKKDLVMLTVPLVSFVLPSFETASTAAFLRHAGKKISVEHLYISFAEKLGGEKYHFARMTGIGEYIIASLLYPEQYEIISEWYENNKGESSYTFDELRNSFKEVIDRQIEGLEKYKGVPVLFYLYSQQFISALYYAQKIKEKYGNEIWFAGYHCNEGLSVSMKKTFPFIDKTIAENVEENVLALLEKKAGVEYHDNLDFLPTPDYDDYFEQIEKCDKSFKEKFMSEPRLQVETSRGCWWSKCSFCTLNCKTHVFRERSIKKVLEDYRTLIDKYNTLNILILQFVNNENWYELLEDLYREYPGLKGAFDMNFKVTSFKEYREFELLKKTDTSLLVGTENYDTDYLNMMNKGQSTIDNIMFLKNSERSRVACYHNFMYGMPYETEEHYRSNKETVELILHMVPPFDDEEFRLTFGSDIYFHPGKYGVKEIKLRENKEGIWFPQRIKETYKPFFYDFVSENEGLDERKEKWKELIEHWRKVYYQGASDALPKQISLLQKFEAGGKLRIQDLRYDNREYRYYYEGIAKDMYLFCDSIKTKDDLAAEFKETELGRIEEVLKDFIDKKIMYSEDDKYLSLAI
ncbi:hypothetical protein D6856_04165 [Butyrivibrio sp. XB500-5]|uniref:hypothetical protein n=1 Tax=Butyrivibrio sp. XB500-5 TaxID=2364880 RepID=UPI000EA91534|nr:hypothetical protein [Butyrivibrio sp. XB500-5]RKM63323.1 hypothetical protein D6856_04165 [Butyrivibrio sp. XB500-5]